MEEVAELVPPETPVDTAVVSMAEENEQLSNEKGMSNHSKKSYVKNVVSTTSQNLHCAPTAHRLRTGTVDSY